MASFTNNIVNADAEPLFLVEEIASSLPEAERAEFVSKGKELLTTGVARDLVLFLLGKLGAVLALESDEASQRALEGVFTLPYTLGEASQETVSLVQEVVSLLVAEKTHAERRLSALVSLFNTALLPTAKLAVVLAIFQFALDADLAALVAPLHTHTEGWIAAWKLDTQQQRALLSAAAQVLAKTNQASLALRVNIRYFQTFKNEAVSAAVDAQLKAATLSAIASPADAFHDRVALLEALKTLKISAQWAALTSLLKVLCDGSLADFLAFKASHAQVFADHKLDAAELEKKVKLLTLCSLAAQASSRSISYQAISAALKIPAEEVELWVIEAISHNLIHASIDQLNSTVTITQFAHRSFGLSQWKQLQQKLAELRKNLKVAADSMSSNTPKSAV